MQPYAFIGNQFQNYLLAKFNMDINSTSALMFNVKGKESLVYEYIRDIGHLFQPVKYDLNNPMGFYSDYESFKKHFVRYWRNALDIARADADELKDIFDEEISTQESCKKMTAISVYFENGKALMADDCLNAIYEVLKIV